ncbi:TetR/AcrR family transcriptional regulator [Phreatobacter sp. AB_2022a]|uniref:TetR/AcrR family transcriptional regulator n=1 Tax=Phreatobacter sp. AB_2022a TaxID=3003134 RepID=UPI000579B5C2|nr:TetR/AcrR family transcriptional regulator [Phreatobacter sp. AB_2022a]MCZ0734996.1 TetR/AcrR family transcriptional regulator [Phreatobacter sp. AB_2022a]CEJ10671.1 putative HTH-type transcriptional regulator YfiR [bacterium YEK0313]
MPRIDDARRGDRITTILDAAERCFVRSGFHGATMAAICAEAGMSAGNLYRYFPSKEAVIEGLCERDFAEAAEGFAALEATDDTWAAFRDLAAFHLIDEPRESFAMWIEIMAEAARNPQIAALRVKADLFIEEKLRGALGMAHRRGHIAPQADIERGVQFMITFSEGLMLRRARDPDFDPVPHVDMLFDILRSLLLTPLAASNDNLT